MHTPRSPALLFLILCVLAVRAPAPPPIPTALINQVPDWNQPTDYPVAPAPGPFVLPADPPQTSNLVTNWCTPTASANIMGWYEDTQGATYAGMGDGVTPANAFAYPNNDTNLASPHTPDGIADYQQNRWLDGIVELGYFMDTEGWKPGPPNGIGTNTNNVPGGLLTYLSTYAPSTSWVTWNYDTATAGGGAIPASLNDYRTGLLAGPPQNGIDFTEPVLVHWDRWLVLGSANTVTDNANGVVFYDWTGNPQGSLGHTVTGVGYWLNYDPDGAGVMPLTDWLICHDGWPATGFAGSGYVAVPWWWQAAPNNTYWTANTHLDFVVPEPVSVLLLFSGALMLLGRPRRQVA